MIIRQVASRYQSRGGIVGMTACNVSSDDRYRFQKYSVADGFNRLLLQFKPKSLTVSEVVHNIDLA